MRGRWRKEGTVLDGGFVTAPRWGLYGTNPPPRFPRPPYPDYKQRLPKRSNLP